MINANIPVEDLIDSLPEAVEFLRNKGIVCILCGEPVWGTLEELASEKGFSSDEINSLVDELNTLNSK